MSVLKRSRAVTSSRYPLVRRTWRVQEFLHLGADGIGGATGGVEVRSARSIALSRSRYLHRPSLWLPAFVEQARALGGSAAPTVNDQPQTSDLNAQPRSIPLTQRTESPGEHVLITGHCTNETSVDEMRQRLSVVVSVISPLRRIRQKKDPEEMTRM